MSRRVMAPPRPVPCTVDRSTPACAAIWRMIGEIGTGRPGGFGAGGVGGIGTGISAGSETVPVGSGPACGEASVSAELITASGVPTGTDWPSGTRSRSMTPDSKHSTSTAALAVSTTATMSPLWTVSPGLISHSTTVPASMSAPSEGIRNSAMSAHRFPRGGDDALHLGQRGVLELLGVRDGHLGGAHPGDRCVELVEGLLGDPGGDLGGQAAAAPPLVVDPVGAQLVGGGQRLADGATVGDQRDVLARPANRSVVEVHRARIVGQLAGQVVQRAVLENQDWIGVGQRG